jgi:trk system potassium uptake protein TrkH
MDKRIDTLHFKTRAAVICKYIGQLLLIYSVLLAAPILFSILALERQFVLPYLVIAAAAGLSGLFLQMIRAPGNIQENEALVISALIFVIIPLLAAVPFLQSGMSWFDAFFEAVSGVTTTGLSNLSSVEDLPRTFLFSRAWLQWVGGLGIVVLSVAILLPHSKAALQLFSKSWGKDGLVASTKAYARIILKVYLILTILGFSLLMILGVPWFPSLLHVLAAVSTGGFSSYDDSLAGLGGPAVQAGATFVSWLGALPVIFYFILLARGRRGLRYYEGKTEVAVLAVLCLIASLVTAWILFAVDGFSRGAAIRDGVLLALSAQSTTGYSTVPVAELSGAAKCMLMLFMLIGGNVGSTAGGIKILRLLIVLKLFKLLLVRSGLASGTVVHPRLTGRRLEHEDVERAFLIVLLFLMVIFLSWFPFILMGYHPLDSLFEVVSATCTVGLSAGISSTDLPALLKTVLCIDMLMGRLEIVAFLILFYPPTWIGKKRGV